MNNIILVGFSQSGKTTIGKLLAERTQQTFIELEEDFQKEHQKSIKELVDEVGEVEFREMEKGFLEKMMCKKNKVIIVRSDTIVNEDVASVLPKIGTVVYLQTDKEELKRRLEAGIEKGIIEAEEQLNEEKISKQIAKIEPLFFKVASIIIQTAGKTPEEIVNEIQLLI